MKEEWVKSDVLCVGGGIAGLTAAIRASELGAKVIVAEKGNTLYSGSARVGTDHFRCYIPEVHGLDPKPIMEEYRRNHAIGMKHKDFADLWIEKSFELIKIWHSWGIPMKYKGQWEFQGHSNPGHPVITLHYSGEKQKPIMTKKALDSGVKIMNRVMVLELLCDGGSVIGAVGISTRENKIIVFEAKSIILATGRCLRLYPGPTPGWLFNVANSPTCTGDGRAMAYRAGAELSGMEMSYTNVGPKYFSRGGQATWIGVYRYPDGKPLGPLVSKPNRKYGDTTAEANKRIMLQYAKLGKGPIYMDCAGMSDEDYEYMKYFQLQEGNRCIVSHLEEEGIDPRKNPIEFMSYEMRTNAGVYHNVKSETNLKGLYAAGDEFPDGIGVIPGAAIHGYIAGENAANYSKQIEALSIEKAREKIEEVKEKIKQIGDRKEGPSWKEANIALQQVMGDYVGDPRSESLLQAGLDHLRRLKDKAHKTIMAQNPHELGRCLEVLNLLDIGELIFIAATERKETRGLHIRADYPFTLSALEKFLVIKKIDDKPIIDWKEIRR